MQCLHPGVLEYLPGDREVVLPLAAGPDDQVSLVQGLHHLLRLLEADVVEAWVGDHTLDVGCRERNRRLSSCHPPPSSCLPSFSLHPSLSFLPFSLCSINEYRYMTVGLCVLVGMCLCPGAQCVSVRLGTYASSAASS